MTIPAPTTPESRRCEGTLEDADRCRVASTGVVYDPFTKLWLCPYCYGREQPGERPARREGP